jgi:hypothetical protein
MPIVSQPDYNDLDPMCAETVSTLSVHSDGMTPEEIAEILQIEPTGFTRKAEGVADGRIQAKFNVWRYSTGKLCMSKDTRRHIDLVLNVLDGKADAIGKLQSRGCQIRIASHWVPANEKIGGGPLLAPHQMLKLGNLGITVSFWFISPDEDLKPFAAFKTVTLRKTF